MPAAPLSLFGSVPFGSIRFGSVYQSNEIKSAPVTDTPMRMRAPSPIISPCRRAEVVSNWRAVRQRDCEPQRLNKEIGAPRLCHQLSALCCLGLGSGSGSGAAWCGEGPRESRRDQSDERHRLLGARRRIAQVTSRSSVDSRQSPVAGAAPSQPARSTSRRARRAD